MKKNINWLLMLVVLAARGGQDYSYSVNLTKAKDDKISVILTPPEITQNEIDFMFPAMVPGTYEVYDFGRFISNFKVTGKNNQPIIITKIDANTWRLKPANQIEKISYDADDTFDKCSLPNTNKKIIFEPGGTGFEDGKVFCINTHGIFGYFKGMTDKNFILEFEKPTGFYPSTGLSDITCGVGKDLIKVFDYHDLVDSPILYCKPDTTTVLVANTKVLVSVYSPNKMMTSHFAAKTLKELLNAQKDYLGGELPVKKYAFLFYFDDKPTQSGSFGALEHSYSSFYVMPEYDSVAMEQQLRDVTAHEFFHIVTPLNIHAREIGDFDFNHPNMSEHLWLYEGMTEYAAHHAQLKSGLITIDQFLNTMMQKYQNSQDEFNDTMSFTYMSKHVLEEKIHKQYNNVYEKGALIGMCLDVMLRDLSNGNYGTQNLMKDLATKYGKNKSFNDKDLFNDIERFTYPQIGEFLRKCVGGGTPLPMKEVLEKIGITFDKEKTVTEFSLGNPDLSFNPKTSRLIIADVKNLDAFGKELGFKKNDELYKLNGVELKVEKLREAISSYYAHLKEGDRVTVDIYRKKFFGYKKKTLSATAHKVEVVRKNQITLVKDMSNKQKQTLNAWSGESITN